ncbi:MFS transporter [Ralstonia solanacearum]|uniref:MFS transporter n=1 Tax=Ralstonia solanacearum TaxID=305 RepID=UPI000F614F68|nr:MFS transporter [Ralstonia solanacearum]
MSNTTIPLVSTEARAVAPQAYPVLVSSTFSFTICFAIWTMFAILGIPLQKQLGLSETEFGLIASMPVLTGSLARVPLGIWTDRYGGRIVFFLLMLATVLPIWLVSYPQTQLTVLSTRGPLDLHIGLTPVLFTVLMCVVGTAMAIGKASVFKFIANDFTDNIGAVSGVVGLAGGLAGFVLPILFGVLVDLTGIHSTCFMLLYGTVCVSLVLMHFSFRAERGAAEPARPGGLAQSAN